MQIDLFNKISESDLIFYDNPEFYEKYTIANNEADTRLIAFYDSVYNYMFKHIRRINNGIYFVCS